MTVTYGDRLRFLKELLYRALKIEQVSKVIVVSNAAKSSFEAIEMEWGNDRLSVLRLNKNEGSALAYLHGIQEALKTDANYIWLMDDDNAPAKGALAKLITELKLLGSQYGLNRAAVLGFRQTHASDLRTHKDVARCFPARSSFMGFHFLQLFSKLVKRLPRNRHTDFGKVAATIDIPYGPYGGMLAHRDTYSYIGLPKTDFVLYADDTEYTWRITKAGGCLRLVTNALIDDLEKSWNSLGQYDNSFELLLNGEPDFRVYYSIRNQAWLYAHTFADTRWIYNINKIVFKLILYFYALPKKYSARLALIHRAMKDGESGRLGLNADFPLP